MLVEVEALQHGGVGLLELPLLAGGAGVTGAHEHTLLRRAAVHAAVADGVVQTLVLQGRHSEEFGWLELKTLPALPVSTEIGIINTHYI